jgi:hypothetical protein
VTRRSKLIAGVAVATIALLVGGVWFSGDRKPPAGSARAEPTMAQRRAVQDRIDKVWPELAKEGIFVAGSGQGVKPCTAVELFNPTSANIHEIERRFGPAVCVSARPSGGLSACTGILLRHPLPRGPVVVPDLRGLDFFAAEQRLARLGLRWSTVCVGSVSDHPKQLARDDPARSAKVTRQCPRPGENVPRGAEVSLDGVAELPGGFDLPYGPDGRCRDGRQPWAS